MIVIISMYLKKKIMIYRVLSDLSGLYAYTKDKINIKPYIIIGNEL